MVVRGIRGAITVEKNASFDIIEATKVLLQELIEMNHLVPMDIASIFFTVTPDLTAEFPAVAARELGLTDVPLLCANEIPVLKALPFCVRVLMHVNTTIAQQEIKHLYLRDAVKLRPDLQSC